MNVLEHVQHKIEYFSTRLVFHISLTAHITWSWSPCWHTGSSIMTVRKYDVSPRASLSTLPCQWPGPCQLSLSLSLSLRCPGAGAGIPAQLWLETTIRVRKTHHLFSYAMLRLFYQYSKTWFFLNTKTSTNSNISRTLCTFKNYSPSPIHAKH